jgi:hypothetical protein
MPLSIPVLDDLTWQELVEDGRERIPSTAPRWTDHNAHDPGITLLELLASVVEQASYRIDRVPPAHRAAFLALLDVRPQPAVASTVVLQGTTTAGVLRVSRGWELVAESGGAEAGFVVAAPGLATPIVLTQLELGDPSSRRLAPPVSTDPFEPFGLGGEDPLGLVLAPPAPAGQLVLWFEVEGGDDLRPWPVSDPQPAYQPVSLAWESSDGSGWQALPESSVRDRTRGLRRSGPVSLDLSIGGVVQLRCRVVAGRCDRTPVVRGVWCNPVVARASMPGPEGDAPAHASWSLRRGPGAASTLKLSAPVEPRPGRRAETIDEALGRAAVRLSAHERLVELAERHGATTLDAVPRDQVLQSPVPARAATTLDYERLAFATPCVQLARVRAFRDTDLDVPCADAPGTLSVVVVPFLPRGEPTPAPQVLTLVARQLAASRTLGTRLRVRGPTYVGVCVAVSVVPSPGVDRARLTGEIEAAVRRFLDPLVGGPRGRGWPFGRDVYRAELMHVVSGVPGVHLVAEMRVSTDPCDACPNACVPDGALVRVDALDVEVYR